MVRPDPTGVAQLRAWYTQGWDTPSLGMATSNDGGFTWTKATDPVVGRGFGGVAGYVGHTGLWLHPTDPLTLHISYTDPSSGATTLRRVTSTDGGLTWGSPVTILTAAGWESGRWGNSACVYRSGTWHLLYENMATADSTWKTGYATSTDGVTFTRQNSGNPVTGLAAAAGGMYGGLDLHDVGDGTWELFYHAAPVAGNLPTFIYRATSPDLINWTVSAPLLRPEFSYEYDQVADPHVITIGSERVMFYSGVNNPAETSTINRAVYDA